MDAIHHAPFILAVGQTNKINTTRVLESLIIAGITGGIVMYGAQAKLDAQMTEMRAVSMELRVQFAELKSIIKDEHIESLSRDNRLDDRINALHGRSVK